MKKKLLNEIQKQYSWLDLSDTVFAEALSSIITDDKNLFIHGPAGSGKSVLLRLAYEHFKEKCLVLSSTGIAANALVEKGIPAMTIHSALQLSPTELFEKNIIKSHIKKFIAFFDVIIIEEVSMVSALLFDTIYKIINSAEKLRRDKSNIRLLVFGDLFQLSPVISNNETVRNFYEKTYKGHIFFFHSKSFTKRHFRIINLEKIFRQNNIELQAHLNKIRYGAQTDDDLNFFNENLYDLNAYKNQFKNFLVVTSTNRRVKELNDLYGVPYANKHYTYYAKVSGDFDWDDTNLDPVVTIYEGQQIMCISNDVANSYQNGTLGTVVELFSDGVKAITFDGRIINILYKTYDQYTYEKLEDRQGFKPTIKGSARQIACKPAFAVTIHKSQGLTLNSIYLDLSTWTPEAGIYVALSRCKSIRGIGLNRKINNSDILVNEEALDFAINNF